MYSILLIYSYCLYFLTYFIVYVVKLEFIKMIGEEMSITFSVLNELLVNFSNIILLFIEYPDCS